MSQKYPTFDEQQQHLINASLSESINEQYVPILNQPSAYFLNSLQHENMNIKQQIRYNHDSFAADSPNPSLFLPSPYFDVKKINENYLQKQNAKNVKQTWNQTPKQTDLQDEIIHKVQYGDTLQGLSLIYSVPISRIKQRNNIDGDSIYYLKQLVIPNPTVGPMQFAKTKQVMIQQFIHYMRPDQKSSHSARYYLDQANWNIEQAVKLYKDDLQWERKNKVQIKSITVKEQFNNKKYTKQEIQMKKRN